jgi:polyisoprenoid-binding protein YceI
MTKWQIDSAHTAANFAVRHMMISTVRGGFSGITGTVDYDAANPSATTIEAEIPVATINTGAADRDNHLRSADFFDSGNFPAITFKSTSVEVTSSTEAKVTGNLTIRGTTLPVVLHVEQTGTSQNPYTKAPTAGFTATTQINREDFGLTWNQMLETGGVLVGKDIKITLDVELVEIAETVSA